MIIVSLSLAWIIMAALFEVRRKKSFYPVDFLSIINVLFILNFAFPPIGMAFFATYEQSLAGIFNGKFHLSGGSIPATLLAFTAHIVMASVYAFVVSWRSMYRQRLGHFSDLTARLHRVDLGLVFLIVGALGVLSFYVYAQSLGGFQKMWDLSFHLRASYVTAKYGFLKIIAIVLVPSFYLAFSQIFDAKGYAKIIWSVGTVIMGALAGFLLIHDGSRLFIVILVLTPILALFSWKEKWFYYAVPSALIAITSFYVVADNIFNTAVLGPAYAVDVFSQNTNMTSQISSKFSRLLSEFGFPYVVLSTYIDLVPDTVGYRYLNDLYNGFIVLMPSFLVGADPEYILDINRIVFDAENPIDLLSFGYVGFGLVGSFVVVVIFGTVIAACDGFFANAKSFFDIIIRTAFLLQIPWLLMYGDPVNGVKRVFATSMMFALIMVFVAFRTYRSNRKETDL